MIAKGNTHKSGSKLAWYMTHAKEGERAELWELRGFASDDIRDAFRSVHLMAQATHCEAPFFHLQVRNPEDEELTRDEWRRVADRIESKLGLTGQPRAIVFHIDKETGHEHMHVAWSRIDEEEMKARALPFFKERLKEASRSLEKELGLTRVPSERDGPVQAPNRDEFEQARRLGVDIREVRETIRDCWDRSDCGRSFENALAYEGLVLARGDKRDFVVIDNAGGMHALGKRILGISAAETRERMADLPREYLPTVEQARDRQNDRERSQTARIPDVYRDNLAWEDRLARAAIEKERNERQFVEEPGRAAGKEPRQPSPFQPQEPSRPRLEILSKSPEVWAEHAGWELTTNRAPREAPKELRGAAAHIWNSYNRSPEPAAFAASLDERGIALAVVTQEEADRSYRESRFAREIGRFAPAYREGEVVAVTEAAHVYRLNSRMTGDTVEGVDRFLKGLDRTRLQGLDATKELMHERAEAREAHAQLMGILQPVKPREINPARGRDTPLEMMNEAARGATQGARNLSDPAERTASGTGRTVGKVFEFGANLFEALFAPRVTPEQKREAEYQAELRAAENEFRMDLERFNADRAEQRRRQEQAVDRDRGGRDR